MYNFLKMDQNSMKKVLFLIIITLFGYPCQLISMGTLQGEKPNPRQERMKRFREEKSKAESIIQAMNIVLAEHGDNQQIRDAAMQAIDRARDVVSMVEWTPPHLIEQRLPDLIAARERVEQVKRHVEELMQQIAEQSRVKRRAPAGAATAAAVGREEAERERKYKQNLLERQQRRQAIRKNLCSAVSPENICIASHEAEHSPLVVSRKAVQISPVLQKYLEFDEKQNPGERPLLILENSFEQVRFIINVLSFLKPLYDPLFVLQEKLEQESVAENRILIEQDIEKQKQSIVAQINVHIASIVERADISFVEAVELAHFFGLPIVFDVLVHIQQPMPIPQSAEDIQNYNDQLVGLFTIAQQASDNRLWQLIGRMLYPCHAQCPIEIEGIVQFLEAHKDLEQIVLSEYRLQHLDQRPQAYTNLIAVLPTTDWQNSIAYSPDGSLLASASTLESTISLWDTHTNQLIIKKKIGEEPSISDITFSPDGTMLAAIINGTVFFFDSRTLAEKPVPADIRNASVLAFNPTNQTMAIRSSDPGGYRIQIYDLIRNVEINRYVIKYIEGGLLVDLVYSPDGTKLVMIVSVDHSKRIPRRFGSTLNCPHVIDLVTHAITVVPEPCSLVRFSNDSTKLITDKYVWDLATNVLISRLPEHRYQASYVQRNTALAVHPLNSAIVALGTFDNAAHVFQINGPENIVDALIVPTQNEVAVVNGLAFHPHGSILAIALGDNHDSMSKNIRLFGCRSLRQALLTSLAIPGGDKASTAPVAPVAPSTATASHQPPIAQLPIGQAARDPAAIAAQEQEEDDPVVLADPRYDQAARPTIAVEQQAPGVPPASAPAQATGAAKVSAAPAPTVAPIRGGLLNTLWEKGRDWWKGGKKE
jgi:WD40 repeat protein